MKLLGSCSRILALIAVVGLFVGCGKTKTGKTASKTGSAATAKTDKTEAKTESKTDEKTEAKTEMKTEEKTEAKTAAKTAAAKTEPAPAEKKTDIVAPPKGEAGSTTE